MIPPYLIILYSLSIMILLVIKKWKYYLQSTTHQDCTYTGRSTGSYIVFFQVGPIDHCTHVTGPVAQSSSESEYNAARKAGMALTHYWKLKKRVSEKGSTFFSITSTSH